LRQPTSQRLDDITTEWEIVHDVGQFVERYAPAVRRYLRAVIRNVHDAEEVAQDFFLRVSRHGFVHVRQEGGRFRNYLKKAVRNAALNFLRWGRGHATTSDTSVLLAEAKAKLGPEQLWTTEWRSCLLERALHTLQLKEGASPGNL